MRILCWEMKLQLRSLAVLLSTLVLTPSWFLQREALVIT